MISFIVTTYNLADWLLRRCLRSIVEQSLARDEYEIIVVDDESAVSPQHVVDEFVEQANITLYTQRHARQGAARNLGLQHARGEWIQFVDGDDYLFPRTIPSSLALAKENDLDLLMFGFRKVYSDGVEGCPLHGVPHLLTPVTTGNGYMLRYNLFGSCCMMLFRRSLLESTALGNPLRFTEDIYIEDEEFVTKLVWRAQRMAVTNAVVYAYYQRLGSTVHNHSREHLDELFRNSFVVLHRLIDFEKSVRDYPHEGLVRKIRFFAVDILRCSLREEDWTERWESSVSALRAVGLYPLPLASYSSKYRIFRLLSQHRMGRYILRFLEKTMNR